MQRHTRAHRSVYASVIMYRMSWTDERLDEFAKHVDQRFDVVDRRFDRVDADLRELRKDLNAKFDGLQRTLLVSNVAIIAALIGVIATQL